MVIISAFLVFLQKPSSQKRRGEKKQFKKSKKKKKKKKKKKSLHAVNMQFNKRNEYLELHA